VNILVCVKQVPDSTDTLRIDERTGWLSYTPSTVFRMNGFDEFAVEEALLIRERLPGTLVHALSVGPERVCSTVRRALELGADHGIHILSSSDAYLSPFTVASLIAAYARTKGYDLVLTGVMAEDDMEGQVGPLLAEFLSISCSTSVISLTLSPAEGCAQVERETEGGLREIIRLALPALLSLQSGINKPRYPSLSNVLRALRQELEIIPLGSMAKEEPRQDTIGFAYPQRSRAGVTLSGTAKEKAETLVKILRDKSILS
jgi:electron transfer flavoprotein beta subunit